MLYIYMDIPVAPTAVEYLPAIHAVHVCPDAP